MAAACTGAPWGGKNGVGGAQKFVAALQDYGLIGDLYCQQALQVYDSTSLGKITGSILCGRGEEGGMLQLLHLHFGYTTYQPPLLLFLLLLLLFLLCDSAYQLHRPLLRTWVR